MCTMLTSVFLPTFPKTTWIYCTLEMTKFAPSVPMVLLVFHPCSLVFYLCSLVFHSCSLLSSFRPDRKNTLVLPVSVFRKAKNTCLAACVFLRFSQVSQHPACLDHSIQTRESICRVFLKSSVTGAQMEGGWGSRSLLFWWLLTHKGHRKGLIPVRDPESFSE